MFCIVYFPNFTTISTVVQTSNFLFPSTCSGFKMSSSIFIKIIDFLELLLLGPANLLGKQPVPVLSVQAALFAVKDGGALERRRQCFVADFVFEILTKSDLLAGSVFVAPSCLLMWSSCWDSLRQEILSLGIVIYTDKLKTILKQSTAVTPFD
jgi:hypothetical protein